MAKYRNETLGVVNVGGVVIAPKKSADVDDKARGLAGLVKRGILVKAPGRPAAKPAEKPEDKSGDTKPAE